MANAIATYRAKKAAALGNVTSANVFLASENSAQPAIVYVPPTSDSSIAFRVRARGRSHAGTSGNFTPALQFGSSVTATSNTTVATATARTNANDCTWLIEATFMWDSTKQQVGGIFHALNGSTVTADTPAATTTKTAVDLSTAGNGFVVTALFGTSNASNAAYLDELVLEVL